MAQQPAAGPAQLTAEERQQIESWLLEFDQSWHEGRLAEGVASLPAMGSRLRLPALIKMVQIDLHRRWERSEQIALESYLSLYPELGGRATLPVGLVRAEYEARIRAGTTAPLDEIAARFPRQAAKLGVAPAAVQTIQEKAPPPEAKQTPDVSSPDRGTASANLPERIRHYKILSQLDKGGMGTVYKALDEKLSRTVAIKIPQRDPDANPLTRERFLKEAKALAAIQHPNVCPIYEVGESDGLLYMVMSFIEGQTLARFLDPAGMPSVQAATLVKKVALAMKELHQLKFIHRDLKPANIMLDRRKEPVLIDFGLALELGTEGPRLTKTGSWLGTPEYMAPEQIPCDKDIVIGEPCDIYALGVILYHLLAGHPPFSSTRLEILAAQILTQPPPPLEDHQPPVDPALIAVCMKAIAKKPEQRYASMDDFAEALGHYLNGKTGAASAPLASLAPIPFAKEASPTPRPVESRGAKTAAGPKSKPPIAPPPMPATSTPVQVIIPPPLPPRRRRRLPWHLLAPSVGGGVLLLGLAMFLLLRARSVLADVDDSTPRTPVVEKKIEVRGPATLELLPGEKGKLRLQIVRKECSGPVQLDFDDLPDYAFANSTGTIAANRNDFDWTVQMADRAVAGKKSEIRVRASLDGVEGETTVSLVVKTPPSIKARLHDQTTVQQGEKIYWPVVVERSGFAGPVEVNVEGLPPGITCNPVKLAGKDDVANLLFVTQDTTALGPNTLKIVVKGAADGGGGVPPLFNPAEKNVRLTVAAKPNPDPMLLQITPLLPVVLRPGQRLERDVIVQRIQGMGLVALEVESLPDGVNARRAAIGEKETMTKISFSADASVLEGFHHARLVAQVDGQKVEVPFQVVVRKAE